MRSHHRAPVHCPVTSPLVTHRTPPLHCLHLPAPLQWYRPDCVLEFPRGGSQAMVDALVRGMERHGGRLLLRSHVEEVLVEGGRAAGETRAV